MLIKRAFTAVAIVAAGFVSISTQAQSLETTERQAAIFENCMAVDCLPRGYGYDYCTRLCKSAAGISDAENVPPGPPGTRPRPVPGNDCYGYQAPCNSNFD